MASNRKSEGTLFSSTFKIEESKVPSDFRLEVSWQRYRHFHYFLFHGVGLFYINAASGQPLLASNGKLEYCLNVLVKLPEILIYINKIPVVYVAFSFLANPKAHAQGSYAKKREQRRYTTGFRGKYPRNNLDTEISYRSS